MRICGTDPFTFTWDPENRLVKVEIHSDTPQGSWRRVEWTHDALGRRIRQTTWSWLVQSNLWVVTEDLRMVSDPLLFGRNVLELNASNNALMRSYVWGLDLSEAMNSAGGVGGLAWVTLHTATGSGSGTHFTCYDGNGNIVALVSATTGDVTARYEYGPFGEPIRISGPAATLNPFRFSTKYRDEETGLLYYGYRYYDPSTGRWLSRDPIWERGGINLYGFVNNDPVGGVDYFGLFCCKGQWYNPFTHCCRRGKIIKRGRIDTGIRLCSAPTQTEPKVDHVWLEGDGWSAGFYPNGATDGTLPGQVMKPDPASKRAGKVCDPVLLDPCHHDIDTFKNCLQTYISNTSANPPIYALIGFNCVVWRSVGLTICNSDAWYDGPCQRFGVCYK